MIAITSTVVQAKKVIKIRNKRMRTAQRSARDTGFDQAWLMIVQRLVYISAMIRPALWADNGLDATLIESP